MTQAQREFRERWPGPIHIATTGLEAIQAIMRTYR